MITLALACAAALTGCAAGSLASSPGQLADRTLLDERAGIAAENAYQAAAELILRSDEAGALSPAARVAAKRLDRQAYLMLQVARRAYLAGNAAGYEQALALAWPVIADLFSLVDRKG